MLLINLKFIIPIKSRSGVQGKVDLDLAFWGWLWLRREEQVVH